MQSALLSQSLSEYQNGNKAGVRQIDELVACQAPPVTYRMAEYAAVELGSSRSRIELADGAIDSSARPLCDGQRGNGIVYLLGVGLRFSEGSVYIWLMYSKSRARNR